ncbi:DUF3551 domain-containing protein [Bradyrhizobium cenepequi]|uniref:DUF3551 domain-containing protein n=1 Tax=Bradyrhizobium cenepequi TaxID=2821403 RepID=UPI001CE2520F
MKVDSINGRAIGCGDTSMAQCKASASGHLAECFANPFRGRRQEGAGQAPLPAGEFPVPFAQTGEATD